MLKSDILGTMFPEKGFIEFEYRPFKQEEIPPHLLRNIPYQYI